MVHKIIYGVVYPMGEGRPLCNGGDIDISQPVWCQPSTILTSQLNFHVVLMLILQHLLQYQPHQLHMLYLNVDSSLALYSLSRF